MISKEELPEFMFILFVLMFLIALSAWKYDEPIRDTDGTWNGFTDEQMAIYSSEVRDEQVLY